MADPFLGHEETIEALAAQLPSYMPKDPASGNRKLLQPIADELDDLAADIELVDKAKSVQTAQTAEQLERLAVAVDLKRKTGESLEKFRARVLAEYALLTSEGTVADILGGAATILGVGQSDLGYTETHVPEPGRAQLQITDAMVNSVSLTETELAEALERLLAASYALDVLVAGSFEYMAAGDTSDPDKGYDGLDGSGNPKDTGGTYSGLLN